MEPQQSPLYATYMKRLRWDVVDVDGVNIFLKRFPIIGGMAKIHRPEKLPPVNKIILILKQYRVKKLVLEPSAGLPQRHLDTFCDALAPHVTINTSPFLATKTIRIDLSPSEEKIFDSFSEAKRRAVRRAQKLGVVVRESGNISDLIGIKNKSAGLLGFITTSGIRELWDVFAPEHAAILLGYHKEKLVAGVLLIFWDGVAYYWIAGGTKGGKKVYTPTLLVWEALRYSKQRGCSTFDFIGVWDERIPKKNISWKGFTKFKEGFGGKTVYYPLVPR